MKVFVGTKTAGGHVTIDGPHNVTAHGGRWFVYIPQGAGDPIVKVRIGPTKNYDTMGAEVPVTPPPVPEATAFMPAFRAVLKMRGHRPHLEVTDMSELTS